MIHVFNSILAYALSFSLTKSSALHVTNFKITSCTEKRNYFDGDAVTSLILAIFVTEPCHLLL